MPAEAVKERARRNIPDAHDGVERARSDEARIGQDGHARHTRVDVGIVVDREHLRVARVHAPYPRRLVVQARDDERAVVQKVERVGWCPSDVYQMRLRAYLCRMELGLLDGKRWLWKRLSLGLWGCASLL